MKSQSSKRNRKSRPATALERLEDLAHSLPPGEWQQRAESLRRALVAEGSAAERVELTHAECQELLVWYLADEQQGKNVRELYPQVYHHLETCAHCTELYSLLAQTTDQTTFVPSPTAERRTPSLPFLHPSHGSLWYQQIASQLLGGVPSISFLFNPAHLSSLFFGRTALAVKGTGETPTESVLLADRMTIGGQVVDIEALLSPSRQKPDRFQIALRVSSPTPLQTGLRAELNWGRQVYRANLVAGVAVFQDVVLPDLDSPYQDEPVSKFRLTLEPIFNDSPRPD